MIAKEMIAEKVFAEGVAKDIRNFLPAKYENAEFQVMQMNKNNGVQMVGVQVRLQEENVCPVVYVEPFFNEIRLGESVEKVMNEIAKCMEEAGNAPFVDCGINPMDYDSVKEHLAVMLVNTQANKRMLQEMPHENIEDLSAICYVDFPVESNDGKATMKVKNEHLKMWNVDAKEMFHQARANTQPVNTPILQSMDEMMLSIFNEEGHATNLLNESVEFGLRSHDMLYALTNVEKQYGASMITQPEVLNKLEQLFPEGFYLDALLERVAKICPSAGNKGRELLSIAMKDAAGDKFISYNPMPETKPYSRAKPKVRVLGKEKLKVFLEAASKNPWYLEILLGLFCGLRKGEILGLKFQDFDFEKQTVRISRQLVGNLKLKEKEFTVTEYAVIERNPKTENSYRILRVPKVVMQEVKRRQQLIELRKTDPGIEYKNFDYVCCQENGEPRSLTAMNQALTKICNRNGLANITVHGLRHMFATILIELGVPLFKISGLLGHSSVHTTYEYYCEIMDEQDKIIAFVNNTFVPQQTGTEG